MPGHHGQNNKPSQMLLLRVAWSFADLKLLLWLSLLFFSLFFLSPLLSDLRFRNSNSSNSPSTAASMATEKQDSAEIHSRISEDQTVVRRTFKAVGSAAYLFVQMGAYRGGANTFAVVGLASKPLHVYGNPKFLCEWIPSGGAAISAVSGRVILPDWGYGRVYTAVVVNCTFKSPAGGEGSGGRLIISASTGAVGDRSVNSTERIEALVEPPGSKLSSSPPKYQYLYCGSPLYGNLSPQRVREWLAYHAGFFHGEAHFVLYDAGGAHEGVMEVLRPWMEKGMVSLHNVRDQERFDGYYHNQFMIVNDCLHRYRLSARWIFFFDLDEFLYLPSSISLASLLSNFSGFSQFTIDQVPMSSKICLASDAGRTSRMWAMEKLVYRDVKKVGRRDRKYAVQPTAAMAAGVHMSQHVVGRSSHRTGGGIKYFHYHGTIADRRELCKEFANSSKITVDGNPFVLDRSLRAAAAAAKRFEVKSIGRRLRDTPQ